MAPYSDEIQEIVDKELTKERQKTLSDKIKFTDDRITRYAGELKIWFERINDKIEESSVTSRQERRELREEIERDFITRPEFNLFKQDMMNKLNSVVNKIAWTVGTIVTIGVIISWTITLINGVQKII